MIMILPVILIPSNVSLESMSFGLFPWSTSVRLETESSQSLRYLRKSDSNHCSSKPNTSIHKLIEKNYLPLDVHHLMICKASETAFFFLPTHPHFLRLDNQKTYRNMIQIFEFLLYFHLQNTRMHAAQFHSGPKQNII